MNSKKTHDYDNLIFYGGIIAVILVTVGLYQRYYGGGSSIVQSSGSAKGDTKNAGGGSVAKSVSLAAAQDIMEADWAQQTATPTILPQLPIDLKPKIHRGEVYIKPAPLLCDNTAKHGLTQQQFAENETMAQFGVIHRNNTVDPTYLAYSEKMGQFDYEALKQATF